MSKPGQDAVTAREKQFTQVSYDQLDSRHHGAIHMPIYQNSLFAFETYEEFDNAFQALLDNHIYSRGNNPTVTYLEQKLAELEGADKAKCFASGMAAISSAILSSVQQGDHVICVDQAYGPTREFLGSYMVKFGVETTFVDGTSIDSFRAAVRPNTKLLYLESPTSGLFELQNLRECAAYAKLIGALTIIDNTWASPCFQNPLDLGVDLVVHSITKYISGHSDCVGGVILGSNELIDKVGYAEYMLLGGLMTPQTAALVSKGLRTLPLRMQRHEESGLLLAEYMSRKAYVNRVNHPGLSSHPQYELGKSQMKGYSSLFSFVTDEPLAKMRAWATKLQYFKIAVSWGGFESLVTVNPLPPGSDGQSATVVRLYVGMEDPKDLMADIDLAWNSL
ncbi:trans-sulfuration enzyme family protein [Paenibacillus lignilyticus]|uniref:Aminotransferase class I/II-fold pyridoxal phosphate-dependent enzyme n=1 Tax=Paenibacillus lignilyticus TaxID=1172615 RepID=A0ABS5C7P9_9BACL|nr:aminotransferase class I/II-fold pyridoxal phosphate-dependent enzyme [Paenibacillus lignilyticus]MBP3962021.1 aminotransferase class I/II-fold pyridoxal phosphate-dependent enzyme [Paenibacillus lignilyticus]